MRVVNDKIYDVNVVFEVISPLSSLEVVEVTLRPIEYKYFITMYGMREEDYNKVFPEEDVRIARIKPLQTGRMIFSVDFKDLKGGREYAIEVRVRDTTGNEKRVAMKTPYIRQFENIGEKHDIIIGVTYYVNLPEWNSWFTEEGPLHKPLLGYYDPADKVVFSKHIDWLTGHGVNCIFISFGNDKDIKNLLNLLETPIFKDISFSIMYESTHRMKVDENGYADVDKEENKKILLDDMRFIARNFFNRSNYLRIANKPAIYLYESKAWYGNISALIDEVRKLVMEISSNKIHLIADYAHPLANPNDPYWKPKLPIFDGFTTWAGGYLASGEYGGSYEEYIEKGYKTWYEFCKNEGKSLITSILPGFDASRSKNATKHIPLERSPGKFEERLKIALKYSYSNASAPIVRIDTFNDFGENTHTEPTIDELFSYLYILKYYIESVNH
jgi:hypothetical protein